MGTVGVYLRRINILLIETVNLIQRNRCSLSLTGQKIVLGVLLSKLVMCQQTDSFVTVKKGGAGSCHCLLRMWTGYQP
jgi:hypothetical protein